LIWIRNKNPENENPKRESRPMQGLVKKNPKEKTHFHTCNNASLEFAWIRKKNPAIEKIKTRIRPMQGLEKKIQKKKRTSIPAIMHVYNLLGFKRKIQQIKNLTGKQNDCRTP